MVFLINSYVNLQFQMDQDFSIQATPSDNRNWYDKDEPTPYYVEDQLFYADREIS